MYSKLSVALLFLVSSALADGIAPPRPRCPPNEVFTTCGGCEPGCSPSKIACAAVCREGCVCIKGYVRENGKCIPREQCPKPQQCNCGEVYSKCGGCDGTCNKPNPPCPKICRSGCFCKKGHVRNSAGRCIPVGRCPRRCKCGEVWKNCGTCDRTCKNPNPICPQVCRPGCYCRDGLMRNNAGQCVSRKNCCT